MSVSITLTQTVRHTVRGTCALRFDAVAFGCSSKVFAIEVLPKTADPKNPHVRFSHVCSPAELSEFPEDEPAGGSCYFRVDSVEFLFDNSDLVDHVSLNMHNDVRRLSEELNELDEQSDSAAGVVTVTEFGQI